ncbi:MAG: hypothetical protein CMD92_02830 [Gammaproteobacteria bacterium]|nr:hypothetical protein [Gammaproteobacteria bacterium]
MRSLARMKKRVVVDSDDESDLEELFFSDSPHHWSKRAKLSQDHASKSSTSKSSSSEAVENEYVCPITHELFIDPVTAEDGRVYERVALLRMFEGNADHLGNDLFGDIRSPITNEPMGQALLAAHQVRSALAALIAAGVIAGERATTWQEVMHKREEDRRTVEHLKTECDKGDTASMLILGRLFETGGLGLELDLIKAYQLYHRGAMEGNAQAACRVGDMLLKGKGVAKDFDVANKFLFAAALMGSEHACSYMGNVHANGINGYELDEDHALDWFKKMRKCKTKDSYPQYRAIAKVFLRAHGVPDEEE